MQPLPLLYSGASAARDAAMNKHYLMTYMTIAYEDRLLNIVTTWQPAPLLHDDSCIRRTIVTLLVRE